MPTPTVTVRGRLTADPELRFTSNGKAVASFSIASSDRRKNESGEWEDSDKCFLRASVWEALAEHVAETLTQGTEVIATGNLIQREYEVDGQKRTSYELKNVQIAPLITPYNSVTVKKLERVGAGPSTWDNSNVTPINQSSLLDSPPF